MACSECIELNEREDRHVLAPSTPSLASPQDSPSGMKYNIKIVARVRLSNIANFLILLKYGSISKHLQSQSSVGPETPFQAAHTTVLLHRTASQNMILNTSTVYHLSQGDL